MRKLVLLFPFLFVCPVSIFSQTSQTQPHRIGIINRYEFEDKKSGIEKYVKAIEMFGYDDNFIFLDNLARLAQQVQQKTKEFENKDLTESQKAEIKKSLDELNERGETLRKQSSEVYEKRKTALLKPLLDKIDAQIKAIAEQNTLTILNLDDDEEGVILSINESTDITKPVILGLNDFFKTNTLRLIKIDIPEAKIATINTQLFLDESKGIKRLIQSYKIIDEEVKSFLATNPTKDEIDFWLKLCRKSPNQVVTTDIGRSIQKYALENGFTLILDSGKKIPAQFEKFPSRDVTNEFISYYNQMNQ